MKKRLLTKTISILFAVFIMALPFMSVKTQAAGGINLSDKDIEKIQGNTGIFEQVCTKLCLSVGDYAQDYLNQVFREEITISKIVFNQTLLLNANFFKNSVNSSETNMTNILREVIAKWYEYFRKLALICILISLIVVGIRYMLQTPESRVAGKDLFKKAIMAVMLIYFFPFVMRYAFDINEAIVKYISTEYSGGDYVRATAITQISDLTIDDLEFRSPRYITLQGLRVGAGTSEATQLYLSRIEQYQQNVDVMRLMRAFAGVTLRFTYVIIWYIMLAQTYILAIMYLKRYVMIAFLILIYPLVVIGYVVGSMSGQKKTAFNKWCGKFFTTIFLQTIHAIMYGIISGVIMTQVLRDLQGGAAKMNVILVIIATTFLFSGEKLLARFFNVSIDTSERSGIKNFLKKPGAMLKRIRGK